MFDTSLFSRLTRDISDGIIVLNQHGEIVFTNKIIHKILKTKKLNLGMSYADFMLADSDGRNDAFHQFLLDAVYDKNKTHSGELVYHLPNGEKRIFQVTTSFLYGENDEIQEGVIIQIADVTEVASLRKKTEDSARVFVILLCGICLWAFVYMLWEFFDRPFPDEFLTILIELFGLGIFHYLLKRTSITINDMGLRTKNIGRVLALDSAIAAVCLAVLIVIKIVMIQMGYFGSDTRIFMFECFTWSCWVYPITVVIQEFLTRGVVQESIRRIIPGKYSTTISIITSSMFFAALHTHKGIMFMFCAFLLLSVFGIIYKRQKTIWGLCILHYVLGIGMTLLFGN